MCEAAHAFFFVRPHRSRHTGSLQIGKDGRKKSRHLSQMAGLIE